MSQTSAGKRTGGFLKFLRLLLATALAVFLWTCGQIERHSTQEDLRQASAIVVFGAAEYAGRPSPVFKARLDHAYDLYRRGLAPLIITTGGAGGDPNFSEGGVGRDYLVKKGVPESALIAETQGDDTAHSAERVGNIMRTNGIRDCLAVSDAYHMFRIERMLEREGVRVLGAPRPNSRPRSVPQRALAMFREAGSYFLWRLNLS